MSGQAYIHSAQKFGSNASAASLHDVIRINYADRVNRDDVLTRTAYANLEDCAASTMHFLFDDVETRNRECAESVAEFVLDELDVKLIQSVPPSNGASDSVMQNIGALPMMFGAGQQSVFDAASAVNIIKQMSEMNNFVYDPQRTADVDSLTRDIECASGSGVSASPVSDVSGVSSTPFVPRVSHMLCSPCPSDIPHMPLIDYKHPKPSRCETYNIPDGREIVLYEPVNKSFYMMYKKIWVSHATYDGSVHLLRRIFSINPNAWVLAPMYPIPASAVNGMPHRRDYRYLADNFQDIIGDSQATFGGKCHVGETLKGGIARELAEELGLHVKKSNLDTSMRLRVCGAVTTACYAIHASRVRVKYSSHDEEGIDDPKRKVCGSGYGTKEQLIDLVKGIERKLNDSIIGIAIIPVAVAIEMDSVGRTGVFKLKRVQKARRVQRAQGVQQAQQARAAHLQGRTRTHSDPGLRVRGRFQNRPAVSGSPTHTPIFFSLPQKKEHVQTQLRRA